MRNRRNFSRQAVSDTVRRGVRSLEEYESKLGLVSRFMAQKKDVKAAIEALEDLGYPAVCKPVSGSWGRLLAKINDREAAEAVFEHKSMLGAIHNTFYIQEYIEKGDYDVRAFVVSGDPICAITRKSAHWITNTARGGAASNLPLDDEIRSVLRSVHSAIGGEFLAVDLFRKEGEWLVNEVNDGGEFRNSIEPTGTDIPAAVVRAAWERRPSR